MENTTKLPDASYGQHTNNYTINVKNLLNVMLLRNHNNYVEVMNIYYSQSVSGNISSGLSSYIGSIEDRMIEILKALGTIGN